MRFRRWFAALTALAMLLGCAAAGETLPGETPPEEIQAFVEAMFAAVTGATIESERLLRQDMTDEELSARNAECADYRARTIPWLAAVFARETEETEVEEEPPVYTVEDSYAAFSGNALGAEYLDLLAGMGGGDRETDLQLSREICDKWTAQVDYEALTGMNGDYACWLYAPGTQIDYPVVQGEDNSYYLKRMFNGERNSAGTLFIDYRNLPDFQDPNTLVYGHHMRNDSMFGTLTDYAEQAYFEAHPLMLVMARDAIYLLELFAGYTTSDGDHCYDIAISDEEDMAAFVAEAVGKSDFLSGVDVLTTDRLVTLSTCAYAFENARYILIGRLVPVWTAETEYEFTAGEQ